MLSNNLPMLSNNTGDVHEQPANAPGQLAIAPANLGGTTDDEDAARASFLTQFSAL